MSYGIEWTAGPVVLGGTLLLLLVPGFALIAVVILALAAVAAVIALAGAILASPYLIVRTLRRRHAARHQADEESLPEARPTAGALTALAN
jgi:positive regulator of sigma E activity